MVLPGEQSGSQIAADMGSPSRRCTVGQISRSWLSPWHLRGTRVGDFSGIYGRRKLLRLFSNHRPSFRVCVYLSTGLFTGARGQALDGPHVTRRFQRILASVCRLCGARESDHAGAADHDFRALPRMRFHDLRHGAASLMLAQGVPLSTISDILGHSGIRITADTYAHLTDELKRDAANAMDAAFGNTAEQAR